MIEFLHAGRPLWTQLGLALAHFVWQGAAIAIVLGVVLRLLRDRSASLRYAACAAAMLLMLLSPVTTVLYMRTHPPTFLAAHQSPRAPNPRRAGPSPAPVSPEISSTFPLAPAPASPGIGQASPLAPITAPPQTPALADPATFALPGVLSLAAMLWAAIVLALGARLIAGHAHLRRLRLSSADHPLPPTLDAPIRHLHDSLGLLRRVSILASTRIAQPIAFGLLKPIVLLPVAVLTQCPPQQIEAIIAHELAHIRRYDLWINLAQRVVETLLFYHPAVWWVSRAMRAERELCCDDLAIAATGRRADYAEALVEVSRLATLLYSPALVPGQRPAAAAVPFGAPKLTLMSRVRHALSLPREPDRSSFWLAGPLVLVAIASLVAVPLVHPGEQPEPARPGAPDDRPAIRVVDRTTNEPLAGVMLETRAGLRAVTDGHGIARIGSPQGGATRISIVFKKSGFVPIRGYWTGDKLRGRGPSPLTMALHPGTSIGGIVRDGDGAPVHGATIHLRLLQPRAEDANGFSTRIIDHKIESPTDASGRWRCDDMPADIHGLVLRLEHPDYASDGQYHQRPTPPIEQLRDMTAVMVIEPGV